MSKQKTLRSLELLVFSDPEPLKRCEMFEIEKYFDDRWMNDQHFPRYSQRRSSNEDEGVEEDFSSSGSGVESQPTFSASNRAHDFEELTQMMRSSLITVDRPAEPMAKTYC